MNLITIFLINFVIFWIINGVVLLYLLDRLDLCPKCNAWVLCKKDCFSSPYGPNWITVKGQCSKCGHKWSKSGEAYL
jgi:hypothetical protein